MMESHFERLDRHVAKTPRLGQGVYVARGAVVFGDVTIGDHASVWFNAVVRGDINRIEIGHHSNIQDNAVVHLADDFPCVIGHWVTVGHSAIVHACRVGDESLIGMGAVILDGAEVGNQCLIGAKSVVTPGTKIPDGSMVVGTPGKVVRELSGEERRSLKGWAEKYVWNAEYYLRHGILTAG
jgi:carbonic anhydrase/acetyltransferase-like protein (isoleucine patch superfamily)